jgi:peptide deformylase
MDLAKKEDEEKKQPRVFINPEILWKSEEKAIYEEGCLSIPEFYEEVERPAQVRVKYLDLEGREQEVEASGLLATCLQHENRSSQRRAVHRLHLAAQARTRGQEIRQGGQARSDG